MWKYAILHYSVDSLGHQKQLKLRQRHHRNNQNLCDILQQVLQSEAVVEELLIVKYEV